MAPGRRDLHHSPMAQALARCSPLVAISPTGCNPSALVDCKVSSTPLVRFRRFGRRVAAAATSRRTKMTASATEEGDSATEKDDYGPPELPDYDVVMLGPLETSAIALGVSGWDGNSDDANAYVLAVDRGYVLIGAQSPSEVRLLKEYQGFWKGSEAAGMPGVRAPVVYATVAVGGADGASVLDTLRAHSIGAGGAEPDLFCFKMAPNVTDPARKQKALAEGIKAAWELGACPGTIAVDGYDAEALEALVTALCDAPGIKIAFNRIPFSLAEQRAVQNGTLAACKRLGVGVVAVDPLGEGRCVVDEAHPACDRGAAKLLAFIGTMVGGGVQRSPLQVALNYVMSKGAVPELTTRSGAAVWECGGAMLWRLDDNAVSILDERAAATSAGDTGPGGGTGGVAMA